MARPERHRDPWMGGLLLALLLLALPVAAEQARLGLISGEVEIGRGEPPVFQPARSGDAVTGGDAVRTGRDGRVELVWQGSTIRLYGDSLLRLPSGPRGVSLDRGNGLFDVIKRAGESFQVETPEVVVSVKGTRFAVDLVDGRASVSVFRGSVGVRGLAETLESEVLVREGFRALSLESGPPDLMLLRGADPWRAWGPHAQPPRSAKADTAAGDMRAAALRETKQAARGVYQREALERAAQRDPALAESVARLERKQAARQRAPGDGRGAGPAAADPAVPLERPQPTQLDPIADAGLGKLDQALRAQFIQAWVNGTAGAGGGGSSGGGGGGNVNLSVSVVGEERVQVDETVMGQSWLFDEYELEEIVEGTALLPSTLLATLTAAGVNDPLVFVQMLLTMAEEN